MDDSKSFEKKLDRDFLLYLNLMKGLFDNLKTPCDQRLCEVWLTHLVGKKSVDINEKCDRNIYLSRLLIQMQAGKLQDVFTEAPKDGRLPCPFKTFNLPSEIDDVKGFEKMGFQVEGGSGGAFGDFSESSRDGRTYLATRHLPQGMMAFLAVTNNEGEDIWIPQPCPHSETRRGAPSPDAASAPPTKNVICGGKFGQKLSQYVGVPICQLRKSPDERERVLEWMDKIIGDCNKWIQGEDPHNMDLEALFEMLYEDYKNDPCKADIVKHSKNLRSIIIQDIRDKISERRSDVLRRELILDQYEADEYCEDHASHEDLDTVWLQCARRPMSERVEANLRLLYPPEVIERFFELLVEERILIIKKGETEASKRIAELRTGSLDDITKELQKLKKIQEEYKEYYAIYKEAEKNQTEYEKRMKSKGPKSEKIDDQCNDDEKREIEFEIEQARRKFEKERRMEFELSEKLQEARGSFARALERKNQDLEKFNCEKKHLENQREEIKNQIKIKQCELNKSKWDNLLQNLRRRRQQ